MSLNAQFKRVFLLLLLFFGLSLLALPLFALLFGGFFLLFFLDLLFNGLFLIFFLLRQLFVVCLIN
jgi:hypothetical protein